jgi:predicted  nucleic acid-binding Zn-ribbon protein
MLRVAVTAVVIVAATVSIEREISGSKRDFDKVVLENKKATEEIRENQKEIERLAGQVAAMNKQLSDINELWGPGRWKMKKERMK